MGLDFRVLIRDAAAALHQVFVIVPGVTDDADEASIAAVLERALAPMGWDPRVRGLWGACHVS